MNYAEYQSGTNNTNLSFNFEFGVRFSLSTNWHLDIKTTKKPATSSY